MMNVMPRFTPCRAPMLSSAVVRTLTLEVLVTLVLSTVPWGNRNRSMNSRERKAALPKASSSRMSASPVKPIRGVLTPSAMAPFTSIPVLMSSTTTCKRM